MRKKSGQKNVLLNSKVNLKKRLFPNLFGLYITLFSIKSNAFSSFEELSLRSDETFSSAFLIKR